MYPFYWILKIDYGSVKWCVNQIFIAVTNTWGKKINLKGFWFQQFQSMVSWFHCCVPEVRLNIMVVASGRAKLLTSWWTGSRERDRQVGVRARHPSKIHPEWPNSSNQILLFRVPLSPNCLFISWTLGGLTHWWRQNRHDPPLPQSLTSEHCLHWGPSFQHMSHFAKIFICKPNLFLLSFWLKETCWENSNYF
jgi:hypothetical protein